MPTTHTAALPEIPFASPPLSSSREHLVRASDHLWRVVDGSERILGHLRIVADPLGLRYRAERLHRSTGSFWIVGEFWGPDDAVSALRYS